MLSNKSINNTIYDSFFLEKTFNAPEMLAFSKSEIEWLTAELKLSKSAKILDVACGSGRHLKAFVSLGFKPIGLDRSPDCIKLAKKNCPSIAEQIIEDDFLNFVTNKSSDYDLVFIAGASFGYDSSVNVNLEYLKNLMQIVSPDGRLVIQFLNKSWAASYVKRKLTFWTESPDFYTLDKRTFVGDLLHSEKIFIKKEDSLQKKYVDVIYTFTEAELSDHIQATALKINKSFKVQKISDSFSPKKFDEKSSATPVLILQRTP